MVRLRRVTATAGVETLLKARVWIDRKVLLQVAAAASGCLESGNGGALVKFSVARIPLYKQLIHSIELPRQCAPNA